MNKKLIKCSLLMVSSLSLLAGCGRNSNEDKYEDGKLILKLKNLYFSSWDGTDSYTEAIEEKFGVKIEPSSYDYNNWGEQVSSSVNANNLPDLFHFDLESFNFGNTYKTWAKGRILKALPSDLSKWPKVKNLIENWDDRNRLLTLRHYLNKWNNKARKLKERDDKLNDALNHVDKRVLINSIDTISNACVTKQVVRAVPLGRIQDFLDRLRKNYELRMKLYQLFLKFMKRYIGTAEEVRFQDHR